MLPASDIQAYATIAGLCGQALLSIDRWIHSPAALRKDIVEIKRRLDRGNDEYSRAMSKVTAQVNSMDLRLTRLEALEEARNDSPRPRHR